MFPIRSEEDLDRTLQIIDALLDIEHPSDAERDRLEVLTALVEGYEEKHHPIPPPGAIEAIRFASTNWDSRAPPRRRRH